VFGERELLDVGLPARARLLADQRQADPVVWVDPEVQEVPSIAFAQLEGVVRWAPEVDRDLGRGHRQALAGPDQDGHIGPAPGVGGEPDRRVGLGFRARGHPFDVEVALVLALDGGFRG
jgi:hypothetical protein